MIIGIYKIVSKLLGRYYEVPAFMGIFSFISWLTEVFNPVINGMAGLLSVILITVTIVNKGQDFLENMGDLGSYIKSFFTDE